MSRNIAVKPPKNLSPEEEYLFLPHLQYRLDRLRVKHLKNVLITYSGLCVNSRGIIKDCHHAYPYYFDGYAADVAGYQQQIEADPDRLITLDDNNIYLAIFHPWFNYYHWICESLFRLWMVRNDTETMTLILPEFYRGSDFIMSSLKPFCFRDIFFIPSFKSLLVRNLCLPQLKPWVDGYDAKKLREVRNYYLEYIAQNSPAHPDCGEKIYVSRKKAARKKVHNEEEIEPILLRYGFTIINNEDYTFLEQVAIYSKAKYLVSIHGSGLTNMLFMPDNSYILEFHKTKTNDQDWHSHAFWYLSDALGHTYYHQLCAPTDNADTYYTANFIVEPEKLERNLRLMLND